MFTVDKDTIVNKELVQKFLFKHNQSERFAKQKELFDAYLGNYPILHRYLDEGKPNNKIINNYAKFIVDTFCGFFDGNPMIVSSEIEQVQEAIDEFNRNNTTVDLDFEIIKNAAIFGNAYELIFQNEEGQTKSACVTPLNGFVVYDNTIENKPVFAVRYMIDKEDYELTGEVYTAEMMYTFDGNGINIKNFSELQKNEFYQVNMIEYVFNKERQGIFENALSAINAYNQVISDKANDVEYFSDAMLKVIGAELPAMKVKTATGEVREATPQEKANEFIKNMRTNRLIIANGVKRGEQKAEKPEIEFLEKPSSDTTQENLLDRLEKQIFHLSMVANISDENFGNASGVSLRYKLLGMRNLSNSVSRNLTKSFKKRYELVFSFENNLSSKYADEYKNLEFKFTENLPEDETATTSNILQLIGANLISRKTAMQLLPFVDNVDYEQSLIEKEKEETIAMYVPQTYQEQEEDVLEDERAQSDTKQEKDRQEDRRKA